MARTARLLIVGLAVLVSACAVSSMPPAQVATGQVPAQPAALPAFSHIFIVVMENRELADVERSRDAPYLNGLAAQYGLARQFYGVSHPSLPNYLALLGGDTYGVDDDCTDCFQSGPTLIDQLEGAGRSWKGYFESMPGPCFVGNSRDGLYVQKHNPFIYFDTIRQDPSRCGQLVPLEQLAGDLAASRLPDFVWIGPNMRSSTHDGSIADGDRWLAATLPTVLGSDAFQQGGLLVVTYDEGRTSLGCCGRAKGGGRIMTVVASPLGKPGFVSEVPHNLYGLLRTIEDAWGLDALGHAADPGTLSLAEFFS